MMRIKLSFSAGALLMLAILYFFDENGFCIALLLAVMAHEAGHCLALRLLGVPITALRMELSGLRLDYHGRLSRLGEAFAALMGPAFGGLFALLAALAGRRLNSELLLCAAGLSLVLSLYNLLPAPPLDGGRALMMLLPRVSAARVLRVTGAVSASLLIFAGLWLTWAGCGAALTVAGLYIMSYCVLEPTGIKYRRS